MISMQDRAVETFFEAWTPEMCRSVEMFRGEQPTGAWAPLKEPGFGPGQKVLWWRQQLESGATYSIWIGAPEQTWHELTAGMAEPAEERRSLFLEMLGPSMEGAAHALSAGSTPRLVCKEGALQDSQPNAALTWGALTMTLNGQELAPIVVGLEPAFAGRIVPSDPSRPEASTESSNESRMLWERLIELELPISIVLGRTVLPIRDVLKLSAGSLVDLDRRVGDPVEVVVHNVVVARGEVVAVKGNYGVRVKEVISRKDRIALQASAGMEYTLAR